MIIKGSSVGGESGEEARGPYNEFDESTVEVKIIDRKCLLGNYLSVTKYQFLVLERYTGRSGTY